LANLVPRDRKDPRETRESEERTESLEKSACPAPPARLVQLESQGLEDPKDSLVDWCPSMDPLEQQDLQVPPGPLDPRAIPEPMEEPPAEGWVHRVTGGKLDLQGVTGVQAHKAHPAPEATMATATIAQSPALLPAIDERRDNLSALDGSLTVCSSVLFIVVQRSYLSLRVREEEEKRSTLGICYH